MTNKPRPVPLRVPWTVCPSTPYVELTATESPTLTPTSVRFVGLFSLNQPGETEAVPAPQGYTECAIAGPPYGGSPISNRTDGVYQIVRIVFKSATAARLITGHPEPEFGGRGTRYDWSVLPVQFDPKDQAGFLDSHNEYWRRTGDCPDPGAYEIERSDWSAESDERTSKSRHYLIVGHDAYVEVLAEGYSWQSEGTVEGW